MQSKQTLITLVGCIVLIFAAFEFGLNAKNFRAQPCATSATAVTGEPVVSASPSATSAPTVTVTQQAPVRRFVPATVAPTVR